MNRGVRTRYYSLEGTKHRHEKFRLEAILKERRKGLGGDALITSSQPRRIVSMKGEEKSGMVIEQRDTHTPIKGNIGLGVLRGRSKHE